MMRLTSTRRPLFALVSLLLVVVLVGAGCSDTLEDVATVDGDGISRSEFDDELARMLENEAFVDALREAQFDVPESGDASDAVDARLTALWLDTRIDQIAIDAEFEEQGLEVDDAHRELARTRMESFFTTVESDEALEPLVVFDYFAEDLQEVFIERNARALAVAGADAEPPAEPTESELRDYYDELVETTRGQCPTDKQVAHILVETEAEADAVISRLAAGEEFIALAGQLSTDTSSSTQGGQLGCLREGQFVEPFQNAALAAPIGETVGPVQSEFGWHVILVTPFAVPAFEVLRDQVEEQLTQEREQEAAQAADEALSEIVEERLRDAEVTVNPRYGRWVVDEEGPRVEPPETPETRDGRETTTTTTTLPGLIDPEAPPGE